jgi:hypothetical protein
VAAYSNSWRGKVRHIVPRIRTISSLDTRRLSPPCSGLPPFVPTTSFLTPQTPITGHTEPQGTRLLPRGGTFRPRPSRCTNGTRRSRRGSCTPHPVYARTGALPYSPFAESGKVCDPPPPPPPYYTLTPPPFCALPPVCARTGLAPESRRGRAAAPFTPFLCVAPAPFCAPPFVLMQGHYAPPLHSPRCLRGRGRYVTPRFGPALYLTLTPPFLPREPPSLRPAPRLCANRVRADAGGWPSPHLCPAPVQPPLLFAGAREGMCPLRP